MDFFLLFQKDWISFHYLPRNEKQKLENNKSESTCLDFFLIFPQPPLNNLKKSTYIILIITNFFIGREKKRKEEEKEKQRKRYKKKEKKIKKKRKKKGKKRKNREKKQKKEKEKEKRKKKEKKEK